MKNILIGFLAIFTFQILSAQTNVCFNYDGAGNRIKRLACGALPFQEGDQDNILTSRWSDAVDEEILILPNPTTGSFTLITEDSQPGSKVIVRDMTGVTKIVWTFENGQFDLEAYPAGIYVVTFLSIGVQKSALLVKVNR